MDKKLLRKKMREQKKALTPEQIEQASKRLTALFLQHPLYRQAKAVYGYLSYNQEVRTDALLRCAQRDGKRVAVPKVEADRMVFYWLDDLEQVQAGYRGIP